MRLTFTSQQRRAIEAPLGAVLVVAGPGAGKTASLIGRVGYLAARLRIPAGRILAVTFTNKAAEEVAARLTSVLGPKSAEVRRSTIHALCADILREFAEAAGLQPGFGIADEEYQRTLLRQMRQGQRTPQLLKLFGKHRLMEYRLTPNDQQLFREYQKTLRRRNIVDFDDLVVLTGELFLAHPEIATDVAGRWDYVLVDEFQDVNRAQYEILRRLAQAHGNIFAVGDDEQSIFSWAGADPAVLKRFQSEYRVVAEVVLDINHRTTHQIFGAARRLLQGNPSLFKKELTAPRIGAFEVRALAFSDDDAEAQWILADIAEDRTAMPISASGAVLDWGDFAVLYRKHEVGNRLETAFLKAGVPCRLAKGRPLSEDKVIGQVIAALALVRDPRDASAAETFARKVLPPHLMQRLEAEVGSESDFLLAVRDLAGAMPQGDPDTKKLWRLIYRVENLAAMPRKHATLTALVDELLTERAGVFKNVLEDRHEDLADPSGVPAAVALASRLAAARAAKSRVVLERMNGLEIALRGMLFSAGFKLALYADEVEQNELDDMRLGTADAGPEGLAYTLFKALQAEHARALGGAPRRYVTFDLETTGMDTGSCEIVEIAAVRAEAGQPVDEFHSLVCAQVPVEPGAQLQHGYSDADLAGAPRFEAVWPAFQKFVGADPLVAHNGQDFDIPVLRRMTAAAGFTGHLQAYDSLPLARSLGGGSARLTALAARFGIEVGRAHHALDDARMLVGVYHELERQRITRARKASLVNLLPYLGLAFALDQGRRDTDEVRILFDDIAKIRALGRFSDCLEFYDAERARTGSRGLSLDEVIERLGGRKRMESLREERDVSS
ncbi:MAG TPA: UvrD-helicase domain-containing protein, partial [Gemmatimonadales bacterium]